MAIRFSDMGLDVSGASDFVIRERTPTTPLLILIFLSTLLVSLSLMISINNKFALIGLLFVSLGSAGWYVILQVIRERDMLLATEFQNALFASALGLHNKFSILIKRDGTIIYLDRSFQTLFPDFIYQPNRSIETLLKTGNVSKEDAVKVHASIDRGVFDKVIFNLQDARGKVHNIILSVEPILRPAGFTMLRGREFVEKRNMQGASETSPAPHALSKTSMTLFSHVIDSLKIGVYITSPNGEIVYANALLEEWLGYSEGEITSENLTLQGLLPARRNELMSGAPADFDGAIQIQTKSGDFVKAFINQKVIYNNNHMPMGCTAIVNFYEEAPSVAKAW